MTGTALVPALDGLLPLLGPDERAPRVEQKKPGVIPSHSREHRGAARDAPGLIHLAAAVLEVAEGLKDK